jgi:hypothetical protein
LVLFSIALIFAGAAFSRWFKIFAVIPATLIAWVAGAHLARLEGLSWIAVIGSAFLAGTCLQLGYILGASLMPSWRPFARKQAVTSPSRSH